MRRALLYMICLLSLPLWAEETIVVGDVINSRTGEAIPNANIYFQGTKIGCSSNEEGAFFLRVDMHKKCNLIVSAVGFSKKHFAIEPGQNVGLEVLMDERSTEIADVFITPGVNPAISLMAQVRAHRSDNDVALHPELTNHITEQKTLYLSDIERKHLQRNLWKSLSAGMLQTDDSTYLLPLYAATCQFDISAGKITAKSETNEHSSVLSQTDYTVLLSDMSGQYNFYQNSVALFSKSFVSPLASNSNIYYQFYLADSSVVDTEKHYLLHFRSKNTFYPTFNGEMTIDSATYALRSIHVEVPRQNGVNYLSSFLLSQTYRADCTLQDEQMSVILDFAVKIDTTSHLFPTVLMTRHWQGLSSGERLTNNGSLTVDSMAIAAIDSINSTPVVRVATFFASIIQNAYIPTGSYVEVGNLTELIKINRTEGVRLGVPLRTSEKMCKNLCLEAWVGYGFKDKAWKGGGKVLYQLPSLRRNIIGASYVDQYIYSDVSAFDYLLRENTHWSKQNSFTTALFYDLLYRESTSYNSATRQREFRLWMENDWTDNLETELNIRVGRMGYGDPTVGYHQIPSYSYKTLSALFRVGFDERKVDTYFHRRHIYSRYPVIYLGAEMGSYRTEQMDGDNLYGRLSLRLRHTQPLGVCGRLDYMFEGGLVLGRVPYNMLNVLMGNQTYTYDPYRFTLMQSYQYATDRYLLLHADWDMQGLLFNLIPGIRYLHLHELLSCKVAWGALSERHNEILPLPERLTAPSTPYVELGVGIGNILRVLEVRSVWRVTNFADTTTPIWAMRFRFHIDY